jgi:excisionase family DNA binding protein
MSKSDGFGAVSPGGVLSFRGVIGYIPRRIATAKPEPKMTSDNRNSERLLDSTEAAQVLRINPKTLQAMARSGQFPAIRVGRLWRFQKAQIEKWLTSKSRGSNE